MEDGEEGRTEQLGDQAEDHYIVKLLQSEQC